MMTMFFCFLVVPVLTSVAMRENIALVQLQATRLHRPAMVSDPIPHSDDVVWSVVDFPMPWNVMTNHDEAGNLVDVSLPANRTQLLPSDSADTARSWLLKHFGANSPFFFPLWVAAPAGLALILLVYILRWRAVSLQAACFMGRRPSSSENLTLQDRPRETIDAAPAAPIDECRPSHAIWVAAMLFNFSCCANFTGAIPFSKEVADQAGGDIAESSVGISAWAAGAVVGVILFSYFGCQYLRTSYLAHAFLLLIGASVELFATLSGLSGVVFLQVVILGRAIQGLGAGVLYCCTLAITRASSPNVRTVYFGYLHAGGGVGIVCGPTFSSFGHLLTLKLVRSTVSIAPACIVLLTGVIILLSVLLLCPSDQELYCECQPSLDEATQSEDVELKKRQPQDSPVSRACEAQALLGFVLVLAAPLTRVFIRVAWEVGAMLMLTQRGYTVKDVSVMVSFVAMFNALAQGFFPSILRFYRNRYGKYPTETQVLFCMETFGCLGFFILLMPTTSAFMLGSIFLYCSTVLTAAPLTSFSMKLTTSGTKWISQSSSLLASQSLWGLSCLLAPVYSRLAMAHEVDGQVNMYLMFVVSLAPLLFSQIFVNAAGVHGVRVLDPATSAFVKHVD